MSDANNALYNRTAILQRHEATLKNLHLERRTPWTTVTAINVDLPSIELSKSNVVSINDILQNGANQVLSGKFLLGRLISKSIYVDKDLLQMVIDDPPGKNGLIFHFTGDTSLINLAQLQCDIKVAVMNPILASSPALGILVLICNNPKHIVVLNRDQSVLHGVVWAIDISAMMKMLDEKVTRIKEIGNDLFNSQRYEEAFRVYCDALKEDPMNAILYSNRSAVCALIDQPMTALIDAERGLCLDRANKKLLFRKAKALFLLRNFQDCDEFLKSPEVVIHKEDGQFTELSNLNERCLKESKTGKYDLLQMFRESQTMPFLEHGDYFNESMVKIQPVSGFFHGIVALKAIPAGTLISASKALFFSPFPGFPIHFPQIIASRLQANPSLGRLFSQLYAGTEMQSLERYNALAPVKFARIEKIADLYAYNDSRNAGLGLWLIPSFINSACVDSNCDRYTIGDFMMIRTTRNVAKGEELLLQLYPIYDLFEVREKHFRKRGTVCNCRLCLMESAESPEVRKKIQLIQEKMEEFEKIASQVGHLQFSNRIPEFTETLKEVRAIRPNAPLDPLSDRIKQVLAGIHSRCGHFDKSVKLISEISEKRQKLGWILNTIETTISLCTENCALGKHEEAARWRTKLKSIGELYFGDERLLPYYLPPNLLIGYQTVEMIEINNLMHPRQVGRRK